MVATFLTKVMLHQPRYVVQNYRNRMEDSPIAPEKDEQSDQQCHLYLTEQPLGLMYRSVRPYTEMHPCRHT
ncbi:hypothetical protein CEXT_128121 [Caerostris extrusa]|uniref:Uncharacterized protein n=1 Tax=Caerostris extrusa TaxID=172846 RepID=A0AAV4P042_CAEEX|nr:hypothetical protein CEXT_128121 [Caerostris extrusa]